MGGWTVLVNSVVVGDYAPDFFKRLSPESRRTAEVVAPLVQEILRPASVVDIGCGTGEWLAAFRAAGVKDLLGIDGDWVPRDSLQVPAEMFKAIDLAQPFTVPRSFDLAISLEVAEHLPPQSADAFIGSLTALAPAILFSAAIPFQGGKHHVNEQWPDYWRALFEQRGYIWVDCFRYRLWDNVSVQPYIAQNLVLYTTATLLAANERLRAARAGVLGFPVRVVHPGVYQVPSLRRWLRLWRRASR